GERQRPAVIMVDLERIVEILSSHEQGCGLPQKLQHTCFIDKRHIPEFPPAWMHERQQRHLALRLLQVCHQRQRVRSCIVHPVDQGRRRESQVCIEPWLHGSPVSSCTCMPILPWLPSGVSYAPRPHLSNAFGRASSVPPVRVPPHRPPPPRMDDIVRAANERLSGRSTPSIRWHSL